MDPRRICFDRILPADLHRPQRMLLGSSTQALSPRGKQWVNGSTIRIHFMSGTAAQRELVVRHAPEWTEHANLKFEFVDDPMATIRVAFDENDGAWSYLGTDNALIPKGSPTLNLGWVDKAVILHEFGHMIGLAHEHSSPVGGIVWNEARVFEVLAGPPNYWDEATVRSNVFAKYSMDQIHGTEFDPNSIMLYAFPSDWTLNLPGGTKENLELSDLDKSFVRSAEMYPYRTTPEDTAVLLQVTAPTIGTIGQFGEEDLFKFVIERAGTYIVETEGRTDVVLSVFGPDNPTRLVGTNDDGGEGSNARVRAALQPGTYYAAVRHYSPAGVGAYGIRVFAGL